MPPRPWQQAPGSTVSLLSAGRPRLSLHQARAVAEGVAAGQREGLLVLLALLRGVAGKRLRPGHLRRAEAVTYGDGDTGTKDVTGLSFNFKTLEAFRHGCRLRWADFVLPCGGRVPAEMCHIRTCWSCRRGFCPCARQERVTDAHQR